MNAKFTTAIVVAGLSLTIGSSCASAQTSSHRPSSFDDDRELKCHKTTGSFYSAQTVGYSSTSTTVTITIISSGGPILQIGRDRDDRREWGHGRFVPPPHRKHVPCPMMDRDDRISSSTIYYSGPSDRRMPRFPQMPERDRHHR